MRSYWYAWTDEVPTVAPYDEPLVFRPDRLDAMDDGELDGLVAELDIDHALPPSDMFPASRTEVALRLDRLTREVLPAYAGARNNASRPRPGTLARSSI